MTDRVVATSVPDADRDKRLESAYGRATMAAESIVSIERTKGHNPDGYGLSTQYDRDRSGAMYQLVCAALDWATEVGYKMTNPPNGDPMTRMAESYERLRAMYAKAGQPYGDSDDGLLRWIEESASVAHERKRDRIAHDPRIQRGG